jgi:hypothetical protein
MAKKKQKLDVESPLGSDAGMQGQVRATERDAHKRPAETLDDVGGTEAKIARGIDAHEADPGKAGGKRQRVDAPVEKLKRVSSYEGSLTHDRESRKNPDQVRGTKRGENVGPNETSGSQAQSSSKHKGHLKLDNGAG